MKLSVKILLFVWLMFVAIQVSAQTTSATPQTSQKVENEVVINKKPLKDFGNFVLEELKQNKVNLDSPFSITLKTTVKNGELDKNKSVIGNVAGDKDLIELVTQRVAAINDSGYLKYLEKLEGKNGFATIQQDKDNFLVSIKVEVENESIAKSITSALNMLVKMAIMQKERDAKSDMNSQNNKDDVIMLNSTSFKSE